MKNTKKQNTKPRYEVISYGGKYQVEPSLDLYEVEDFVGEKRYGLAICLNVVENNKVVEPFATFTVSFGEFIGIKDAVYIDTNNCNFAFQLKKQGFGVDTGITKQSGFCTYPLWQFNEEFLKSADSKLYELYSQKYDEYMEAMNPSEDESPDLKM